MSNINRHQAGTVIAGQKTGGQFAPTARSEAEFQNVNPDRSQFQFHHEQALLSESYYFDLGRQVQALQEEQNRALRSNLTHRARSVYPDAAKLVVNRTDSDDDPDGRYNYELIGHITDSGDHVDTGTDGGQGGISNLLFIGQRTDAFDYDEMSYDDLDHYSEGSTGETMVIDLEPAEPFEKNDRDGWRDPSGHLRELGEHIIQDLNDGSDNEEYRRGQIEMLAYMVGFADDSSHLIESIDQQTKSA